MIPHLYPVAAGFCGWHMRSGLRSRQRAYGFESEKNSSRAKEEQKQLVASGCGSIRSLHLGLDPLLIDPDELLAMTPSVHLLPLGHLDWPLLRSGVLYQGSRGR